MISVHEPLVQGIHRDARTLFITRAGQDGPALGDGINPAVSIGGRPQGRAVIKIGAAIPFTVPAILFNTLVQLGRFSLAMFGEFQITAAAGQFGKTSQYLMQEKSQPDAFTLAVFA